jgi:hypothetical protein
MKWLPNVGAALVAVGSAAPVPARGLAWLVLRVARRTWPGGTDNPLDECRAGPYRLLLDIRIR